MECVGQIDAVLPKGKKMDRPTPVGLNAGCTTWKGVPTMSINKVSQPNSEMRTKAGETSRQWRWQRASMTPASTTRYQEDRVEISTRARRASESNTTSPARMDRVAAMRAVIQSGSYDIDARLPEALDRLLEREFHEFYY